MARLLISLMVITIFIAFSSASSDWKGRRQADAIFTSEFSKLRNNIAVQNLVKKLLNGKGRRQADAIFTSELSKLRNNIAVQNLVKNLLNG
ncbi:hypothetical protein GDO81_029065 [Engystomops pustulosus]|uniref:Glucagon / GIP / secretin / VIP family domain-containing protein n=1 Tax=Engystomops pustulosus TaxID=76066 RepID=A0AAV6ZIG1_ENGPU|nr:hypothetical protein GDO81_029065 [Engystomops pustulosus]